MNGNCAGFTKGCLFVGYVVGHRGGFPFIHQDVLGVPSGPGVVLESHGAVVEPGVGSGRGAHARRGMAPAANHAVAGFPSGDARADIDNGARVFVAQNRPRLCQVVHECVDVGAANGGIFDPHDDLVRRRRRVRYFLNLQNLFALVNGSPHSAPLSNLATGEKS